MKLLRGYRVSTASGVGGEYQRVLRAAMSATERRRWQRMTKRQLAIAVEEHELAWPWGCDCSQCRRDEDCCGCLFPASWRLEWVRGGVKVVQRFERNV